MEQDQSYSYFSVILENRTNKNISIKQHEAVGPESQVPSNLNLLMKMLDGTEPVTYIRTLDIPPKTHKAISADKFGAFTEGTARRRALIHLFLGDHKLNDVLLSPAFFSRFAKVIFEQDNHARLLIKAVLFKWSDCIFVVTPKRCEGRPEVTIITSSDVQIQKKSEEKERALEAERLEEAARTKEEVEKVLKRLNKSVTYKGPPPKVEPKKDDLAFVRKKKEVEKAALKESMAKASQKGSSGGSGLKKRGNIMIITTLCFILMCFVFNASQNNGVSGLC